MRTTKGRIERLTGHGRKLWRQRQRRVRVERVKKVLGRVLDFLATSVLIAAIPLVTFGLGDAEFHVMDGNWGLLIGVVVPAMYWVMQREESSNG